MELCGTVAIRASAACENRGFLKPVAFEVILAVVLNGTVFRDGTQCGVARKCQSFAETCCIIFRVEDLFFLRWMGRWRKNFPIPKLETTGSTETLLPSTAAHSVVSDRC